MLSVFRKRRKKSEQVNASGWYSIANQNRKRDLPDNPAIRRIIREEMEAFLKEREYGTYTYTK